MRTKIRFEATTKDMGRSLQSCIQFKERATEKLKRLLKKQNLQVVVIGHISLKRMLTLSTLGGIGGGKCPRQI